MLNLLLTHSPLLYFVQSLWRDEAFSILASQQSLSFIITKLGFEPPLYYTMLHFWIKIFGTSEVASRGLSFFFLNPMLLYYAFEVRTYGWYMFFATATLIAYSAKKWKWFILSAVLGFYTHVYILPFIGILGLHWLWTKKPSLSHLAGFIKKD